MKLIAIAAALVMTGVAGGALAQQKETPKPAAAAPAAPAAGGDGNVQYKAKTVYDFEDDMVEGDLQRPDGELLTASGRIQHSSLIELRENFIPEMLKSLEDI